MKKAQITVSYDEEKLSAITMYLEEKGVSVESEIEKAIDTIYNKTVPVEMLDQMGFPQEVLTVLELLTHDEAVPYMDYVKNISLNPIAKKVKIADLLHNSDVSRLDFVDEYAVKRNQKYQEALRILTN